MHRDQNEPSSEQSLVVPGTASGSLGEVWKLAWPIVMGNLATTVMWTVDTILLGRIGKVELAAAGFGGVLVWTLYTFFVGGVQAVNTFVAQAKGANRPRDCAIFAWQGLYISLAGGLLLLFVLWRFDWILSLARPEPDVVRECLLYSRARLSGAFFVIGTFALSSFFRGIGDVKTPMVVAVIANLANVALDVVLIFGVGPFPAWTTFGAGVATALSNALGFLILMVLFLRTRTARQYYTRATYHFRAGHMRRLLRVGLPMGLQFFGDMGAFSVFMAMMGRLGTAQLAASQIGIQVLSFSFMPVSGIAKAATTLVGQYLGADRPLLSARCARRTLQMAIVYSLAVAAILLLSQEYLFLAFSQESDVVTAGVAILPLLAMFQLLDAVQMTSVGALQGAGDTTVPMAVFIGSSWLVFIPLALVLAYPLRFGMAGGWTAGVIHFGVLAVVMTLRLRRGKWMTRTI